MPAQGGRSARYTFGSYEVAPERLELRKNGTRIRLREQPFRVLVALLEKPGEVVTREELQRLLWAGDTFVDFDKGLNTAVNHLRQVLCDSATEPRYIETVPKHGYRFVGDVRNLVPEFPPPPVQRRRPAMLLTGVLSVLVAAMMLWFSIGPRDAPEPPPRVSPLTSYPGMEDAPSFSPDGSQVVFARRKADARHSDICVQMTKGAQMFEIAATADDEFSPAWSPDGAAIAYLRRSDGTQMDVMIVAPKPGESPRRVAQITYPPLINLVFQSSLLEWTQDGRSILAPHAAEGRQTALWRIDVASGNLTPLTVPEPPIYHSYPRLSPGDRLLAYQEKAGGHLSKVQVLSLRQDGLPEGSPVTVAQGLTTGILGWRGDELLIVTRMNTRFSLQRWDSSTRELKDLRVPELGGPGARLQSGSISRDGRYMAITHSRLDIDIWQAELSPKGEYVGSRPLIDSTFLDLAPDWSRDGVHILFKSTRSGSHEAWMAHADGSHLRQITSIRGLGDPRLSPDGREIVFDRGEDGNEDIFIADVETGTARRLANHAAREANARWSVDGQSIYFDSDRTGRPEIWKVSRAGGEPLQITHNGGSNPFESPDGHHLYYGRNRSIWRMPSGGGQEERLFESLVNWASLAMGSRHMYFVRGESGIRDYGTDIYSYELASGRVRKVFGAGDAIITLAVDPSERRILYGLANGSEWDLILMEFSPR